MQAVDQASENRGATIVLADDDSDLRAIYARRLREGGHVVWEAIDGGQALALVRDHAPEMLLLDIWMPVMNGLEVLERLAGTREAVGLKIVVLSHQSDADTRLEGFALGVLDYWTKDMRVDELLSRIETLLRPAPKGSGHTG